MKLYLCSGPESDTSARVLDKEVIIDNVYFIYELLDECIDAGVIQMTDYNILKEYIKVIPNRPHFELQTKEYSGSSSESDHDDDPDSRSKSNKSKQKNKDIKKIRSTHNQAVKADELVLEENYINSSIVRASSSAINWRPKGIYYAKNEIYVDIVENCEFLYDLEQQVILQNEVFGNCFVKCYLSGMPTCTLGFNETRISNIDSDEPIVEEVTERPDNQLILGEDQERDPDEDMELRDSVEDQELRAFKKHIPFRNIQFHQCVELDTIYKDNLMRFIPPDDKFILMSYHVEQQRQRRKLPLFMVKPLYRIDPTNRRLQVLCVLSTSFRKRLHGKDLKIKIPINPLLFDVLFDDNLKYKAEIGHVNFQVDSSELIWEIEQFSGNNPSIKMMAELPISDKVSDLTVSQIHSTIQNSAHSYHRTHESDEDDNESAKRELDKYYGVNGSKSSSIEEIQKSLTKIQSFNHVKLSYNIPMLSYTGLKLNYLKVDEQNLKYTCFPWVRYVTQSGRTNTTLLASKSTCTYRFKLGATCFEFK
ncbi:hypothetical protein PSN45_003184 [Yamadazyma tenuis]|nr:hypothetical protein PSN45_003184 [Yamadazyma tenuis]